MWAQKSRSMFQCDAANIVTMSLREQAPVEVRSPAIMRVDLVFDKRLAAALTCGICLDLLQAPINCSRGHSYCKTCIELTGKKTCPTCRDTIDPSTAGINFTVKGLIDGLQCRCPHNIDASNDASSSSALTHVVSVGTESESCTWVGEMNDLDAHMKVCKNIPRDCILKEVGCRFCAAGGRKMDEHHTTSISEHNRLLVEAIKDKPAAATVQALVDTVKTLQAKVDELSREVTSLHCYPSERSISWYIHGVRGKLQHYISVRSRVFKMSIPGVRTYEMYLTASFGDRKRRNSKEISIYIAAADHVHKSDIDLNGSSISLLNDQSYLTVERSLCEESTVKPGSSLGFGPLCTDIQEAGFISDNYIVIFVKVKIATPGEDLLITTYR